ncbi:MAG: AmmeMemoRadiSam system protein B [Candidatus Eisenbacteria bacterium]|uniref:AmmeMemoRadiSam system protein B n=1 Tax=Eiseniibacteriota bacterium TaxID=2212470 RepID=A0A956LXT7_UNCEI|nr:AmmeMemoRadiSam system protein B [Candidatus Eisenbacteria bacterium]
MSSETIPRLRLDLDLVPSPDPEQPGYLIRDPKQYTDVILVLPPLLAAGLELFDGEHTVVDLQSHWARLTGQIVDSDVARSMIATLREHGFLQTEELQARVERRHREFAEAPVRAPAHAGSGYPEDEAELRSYLDESMQAASPGSDDGPSGVGLGLAAPHVSPHGGWDSYTAAYRDLDPAVGERTVILLGTSHYGEPDRFGLTRKPFGTPYGDVPTDGNLVDELQRAAGDAVVMEDYCHAIEHSIEFQVLFLRHRLGPRLRIVPILCGAFLGVIAEGKAPESAPRVARFLAALQEFAARHRDELFWVLGVDLSHIGARYGDPEPVVAERERMLEVRARDLARLDSLCRGETDAFLEQVLPNRDDLRWCGLSPLYTFARALPDARGSVRRYQQWNIDPESVVSFAAVDFH